MAKNWQSNKQKMWCCRFLMLSSTVTSSASSIATSSWTTSFVSVRATKTCRSSSLTSASQRNSSVMSLQALTVELWLTWLQKYSRISLTEKLATFGVQESSSSSCCHRCPPFSTTTSLSCSRLSSEVNTQWKPLSGRKLALMLRI